MNIKIITITSFPLLVLIHKKLKGATSILKNFKQENLENKEKEKAVSQIYRRKLTKEKLTKRKTTSPKKKGQAYWSQSEKDLSGRKINF